MGEKRLLSGGISITLDYFKGIMRIKEWLKISKCTCTVYLAIGIMYELWLNRETNSEFDGWCWLAEFRWIGMINDVCWTLDGWNSIVLVEYNYLLIGWRLTNWCTSVIETLLILNYDTYRFDAP